MQAMRMTTWGIAMLGMILLSGQPAEADTEYYSAAQCEEVDTTPQAFISADGLVWNRAASGGTFVCPVMVTNSESVTYEHFRVLLKDDHPSAHASCRVVHCEDVNGCMMTATKRTTNAFRGYTKLEWEGSSSAFPGQRRTIWCSLPGPYQGQQSNLVGYDVRH